MPRHGHGLPTKPRVTRPLGNGDHLVEGMKFNMGGWWVVKFRVASAANGGAPPLHLVFRIAGSTLRESRVVPAGRQTSHPSTVGVGDGGCGEVTVNPP